MQQFIIIRIEWFVFHFNDTILDSMVPIYLKQLTFLNSTVHVYI